MLFPHTLSNHCPGPNRYDGRGHLHDLSEYDSGSWNTSYQLSEEETRIEALCDEERYLALHTDLLEEEARQGGQGELKSPHTVVCVAPFQMKGPTFRWQAINRGLSHFFWMVDCCSIRIQPPLPLLPCLILSTE